METTLAVYEDVVRKVLAADGVARTVAREFVALVAAVADGRLIVNVRRTLAAATSKVTAAGGTPAAEAAPGVLVGGSTSCGPASCTVCGAAASMSSKTSPPRPNRFHCTMGAADPDLSRASRSPRGVHAHRPYPSRRASRK